MTPAEMVCQSPRCNGRLRLPKGTVGRDYVLLQLKLGGKGPFDFVVDTGLTGKHMGRMLGGGGASVEALLTLLNGTVTWHPQSAMCIDL